MESKDYNKIFSSSDFFESFMSTIKDKPPNPEKYKPVNSTLFEEKKEEESESTDSSEDELSKLSSQFSNAPIIGLEEEIENENVESKKKSSLKKEGNKKPKKKVRKKVLKKTESNLENRPTESMGEKYKKISMKYRRLRKDSKKLLKENEALRKDKAILQTLLVEANQVRTKLENEYKELEEKFTKTTGKTVNPSSTIRRIQKGIALFDFQGDQKNRQLSFKKGDHILIYEKHESGWWTGEINGHAGFFPSNFIKEV